MKHQRVLMALLIIYLAGSLYGILTFLLRTPYPMVLTSALTILLFTFSLMHAVTRIGWKRAVLLLVLCFGVALAFESVGVATGLVYGPYHYTERLGPKFLGLVPYMIASAWFMMMYPALVIAELTIGQRLKGWGLLLNAAAGGVIMTAWDLMMDPVMVAGDHWVWEVPGAYFGIPLQNFWGWWLTTFVTFALFYGITRRPMLEGSHLAGFDRLAVFAYLACITATGITGVIFGLGAPVMVSIFAALPWLVWALRNTSIAGQS